MLLGEKLYRIELIVKINDDIKIICWWFSWFVNWLVIVVLKIVLNIIVDVIYLINVVLVNV